jgi:hypothetical protein
MKLINHHEHQWKQWRRWWGNPWRNTIPTVVAGVLISSAAPGAKSDPLDITSPTAIITHPAYSSLPTNIYHTTLYPSGSPEQNIFALKVLPESQFREILEEYKRIIVWNEWFAAFCNSWKMVSEKHKISPENQAKLFHGLYQYRFVDFVKLGVDEYIWLYDRKLLSVLSEITQWWEVSDCRKISENLQKFLDETREARTKDQEQTILAIKAMAGLFWWIIWVAFLGIWYSERRNK